MICALQIKEARPQTAPWWFLLTSSWTCLSIYNTSLWPKVYHTWQDRCRELCTRTHCAPWRPAGRRWGSSWPRPPPPLMRPGTAGPRPAGYGSNAWWAPGRWSGTPAHPVRGTWAGEKPWPRFGEQLETEDEQRRTEPGGARTGAGVLLRGGGKCRRLVSPFGPLTSNFADAQFGLALSALCGSSHGQMDTVLADHHSCQNSSSGPGVHWPAPDINRPLTFQHARTDQCITTRHPA